MIAFEDSFVGMDGPPSADPVGWRGSKGSKREFWVKPTVWREIFDNDPEAAVDAARALREIGLLRVQDTENCQAVVDVKSRDKRSTRAYVVKEGILDWRPSADVAFPANFAELTPEQKHNCLPANTMYLQARLLSSGLALDTKAIAQLAAVAQGIVRTSVELEQLKVG